jgi:hypothetical protein
MFQTLTASGVTTTSRAERQLTRHDAFERFLLIAR